jgi:endonuclease YncB( thermonuclease family)
MSSSRHPAKGRFTLLALLIAATIAFAQWKGWLPAQGGSRRMPRLDPAPRGGEARGTGSTRKIGDWEELQGCILVEDRGNDGDSFVVRHRGKDHTLRLYFADCPEKYRHPYNGDRIAEQGRYFDGLTEAETIGVGGDARDFALEVLRRGPFTVLTRWEPVFDSQRFYAFVTLGQGEDLAEQLVARGLARIHTKGENRPGGAGGTTEKQRLQGLERKAKASNAGAWAFR